MASSYDDCESWTLKRYPPPSENERNHVGVPSASGAGETCGALLKLATGACNIGQAFDVGPAVGATSRICISVVSEVRPGVCSAGGVTDLEFRRGKLVCRVQLPLEAGSGKKAPERERETESTEKAEPKRSRAARCE